MSVSADRPAVRRDTVLFVACLAVSVVALLLPSEWAGSITTTIRETALRPVVALQQVAAEGRTSRQRLRDALAQRDSAVMVARSFGGLEGENARLRVLLGLRGREPGSYVAAEVLRQPLPGEGRTLLLSTGTRDGVREFQPVVAPEGLVGVVARAGLTTSVANTWAHTEFRVSAVTSDGAVLGIVAPSASAVADLAVLEFRGIAYRDTVPDGTVVVTSGLGGVYPRGIPIGTVRGVRREELGWERVYRLVPKVNPGSESHVLVLTAAPTPFPPDSLP
jgi:rod shape-determining protein MreC